MNIHSENYKIEIEIKKQISCLGIIILIGFTAFTILNTCNPTVQKKEGVKSLVNWSKFLGRNDIVWEVLPQKFDHGIFHGNGLMGCMIYQDSTNQIRWEMGHSDVTDHRRDNNRIPIGGMVLETVGEIKYGENQQRLYLSIVDSYPEVDAGEKATSVVRKAVKEKAKSLKKSHAHWWHSYYPKSFISLPDAQIEGFYWVQMYKLACATRQDRHVIDLLVPWYRRTGWPRIWWNLNIEMAYSPVYPANRLELGESFTRFIDAKRDNFVKNAKDIWGFDNCATVSHTTDNEGLRGDGAMAPRKYINPGDFTWALHLYWQQYRYSMDHELVTDQKKHAFYPLLKKSINLYLHLLITGNDGKLHLPELHSPEYHAKDGGGHADNNYNLSLLRWGCKTLIDLDSRYGFQDPMRSEWERVLRDLVAYPQDENGFSIGATTKLEHSHRHWSHLLMVWPLHLVSTEQPENRELVEKTLHTG